MENKKYYYTDPESGDTVETTKEHHDMMNNYLHLKGNVGKVFVAGTGGDFYNQRDQELALWMMGEPANFDILCGIPMFYPAYPSIKE